MHSVIQFLKMRSFESFHLRPYNHWTYCGMDAMLQQVLNTTSDIVIWLRWSFLVRRRNRPDFVYVILVTLIRIAGITKQ